MAAGTVSMSADRVMPGVMRVSGSITQDGTFNFLMPRATHMTLQGTGTFSTTTVKLMVSNDGTNFKDTATSTAITSAGVISVARADIGYLYYQVNVVGGATSNVTITVIGQESGLMR